MRGRRTLEIKRQKGSRDEDKANCSTSAVLAGPSTARERVGRKVPAAPLQHATGATHCHPRTQAA